MTQLSDRERDIRAVAAELGRVLDRTARVADGLNGGAEAKAQALRDAGAVRLEIDAVTTKLAEVLAAPDSLDDEQELMRRSDMAIGASLGDVPAGADDKEDDDAPDL